MMEFPILICWIGHNLKVDFLFLIGYPAQRRGRFSDEHVATVNMYLYFNHFITQYDLIGSQVR